MSDTTCECGSDLDPRSGGCDLCDPCARIWPDEVERPDRVKTAPTEAPWALIAIVADGVVMPQTEAQCERLFVELGMALQKRRREVRDLPVPGPVDPSELSEVPDFYSGALTQTERRVRAARRNGHVTLSRLPAGAADPYGAPSGVESTDSGSAVPAPSCGGVR